MALLQRDHQCLQIFSLDAHHLNDLHVALNAHGLGSGSTTSPAPAPTPGASAIVTSGLHHDGDWDQFREGWMFHLNPKISKDACGGPTQDPKAAGNRQSEDSGSAVFWIRLSTEPGLKAESIWCIYIYIIPSQSTSILKKRAALRTQTGGRPTMPTDAYRCLQ